MNEPKPTKFYRKLLLLLYITACGVSVSVAAATGITVTGTVTDANRNPLPGLTVSYTKGTNSIAVLTDKTGNYELKQIPADAVIEFSFVGMATQRIPVEGRTRIDVTIQEDTLKIDEVVVIGYGAVKKSDLTGSVASVKASALNDMPANSIEGLLQGRVAGVQVVSASQDPGAGSTVRIRGSSSLRGSNSPLVVVDGFPLGEAGDMKQINPQDIVSMEVLKDASASAIYGSRGANGVILITTRRARKNMTQVTLHQQTTLSQFTSKLDVWRDPVLMAILDNESKTNANQTPLYVGAFDATGIYYPSIAELQSTWTTNTRWDDLALRDTPVSNSTTVQVASSTERTSLLFSANYYTDKGVYVKDDYKKYGANFSVEHKLRDNLTAKLSTNITKNDRNNNGGLSYSRNPIFPVYNEDGSYFQYNVYDYYNPVALTNLKKDKASGMDIISYASLDWQALDCLNFKGQFNYKHGQSETDRYSPKKYTEAGAFNDGQGEIHNWKDNNVVVELYGTFDKTFNRRHRFTAMAGYSYENYQSSSSTLIGRGFVNEALGYENLKAGDPQKYDISNSHLKTELVSFISRLNYALLDRYLFTFTARADGSSKFGKDNKYAFFPSGAVSWKLHEENFIKKLNVFSQLKLRASYGISGNQGISAYQTLSRYGMGKYYYNDGFVTAIGPGYTDSPWDPVWYGIPNTGLKWETTSQWDIGVEMSFFRNRLNVTFDWYNKETSDLLREKLIPSSSGYDRMWVNNGAIRNRGVELTLDGTIYQNRDLKIGATLIYSRNRNTVTDLGNSAESGLMTDVRTGMQYEFTGNYIDQYRTYSNILAIGQPLYAFYGYRTEGIVQSAGEGLDAGLSGADAQGGEYKYLNIYNGDGLDIIDENDRCIIGDPNPDWTGSFGLNISYKRFDFSIFLNGVFGNDVLNTGYFDQPSQKPLRWTPDNRTNDYPSLRADRQIKLSDWWIEDGSFVRIQNITLGYTLPIKKLNFNSSVRFYVNINNLYTFSKFSGYDPEVGSLGIYGGAYPRLRKFTFGVMFTL